MDQIRNAAGCEHGLLDPKSMEVAKELELKSQVRRNVSLQSIFILYFYGYAPSADDNQSLTSSVSRSSSSRSELTSLETSMSGLRMSSDSPPLA